MESTTKKRLADIEARLNSVGRALEPHASSNWDPNYKWKLSTFTTPAAGKAATASGAAKVIRQTGPASRDGEPLFTEADVAKQDGSDGKRAWVSYRDGVSVCRAPLIRR